MMPFTLFVVDDEDVAREGITLALRKLYDVHEFARAEDALEALSETTPDLVLLDIGLPGISGIEALSKFKELNPDTLVIMITAYEDVQTIVSAMKNGAYDYCVKPIDMNGLVITVRNALETIQLKKEIRLLQEKAIRENQPIIIGESQSIKKILEVVGVVAKSPDTPVLILGETGSGKELIAKTIHFHSPHFKGPLVSVNCAAIPTELIESELFGYERGAFSGADRRGKPGLVEEAADGTLFLDELADLSSEAQAKMLRFLESGEFFRIGSTQPRKVQTRVVSATNKDIFKMMQSGQFRQDLFFRLAVVQIEVPSLNERPDDIMPLAKHFLVEFARKFKKSFTGFTAAAEHKLKNFYWTGNIRELKNLIERGVLLGEGELLTDAHLGLNSCAISNDREVDNRTQTLPELTEQGIDMPAIIDGLEKKYFASAMNMAGGNECKAAKLLNLSRDKFRYRKQKMGLPSRK